jgi:hypothetical protein
MALVALLGLTGLVFGMLIVVTSVRGGKAPDETTFLVTSVGALGLALVSIGAGGITAVRRDRRREGYFMRQEFIRRMTQLEDDARQLTSNVAGPELASGGLAGVFEVLKENELWTSEDIQTFRLLLQIRNALVHEQVQYIPQEQLGPALAEIERLRDLVQVHHHRGLAANLLRRVEQAH